MTKRQIKNMFKISSIVFVEMMSFILNVIIVMVCMLALIISNIISILSSRDTEWISPIKLMKDIYKRESEFYSFLKAKLNIVKNRLSQSA